jgi:hypothetical protein
MYEVASERYWQDLCLGLIVFLVLVEQQTKDGWAEKPPQFTL